MPILSAGFSAGKSTCLCARTLGYRSGRLQSFLLFRICLKWPPVYKEPYCSKFAANRLWEKSVRGCFKGKVGECKLTQIERSMRGTLNDARHNEAADIQRLQNKNTSPEPSLLKACESYPTHFLPTLCTVRRLFEPVYQSHCKCHATGIYEASSSDIHHPAGHVDSRGLVPILHPLQGEKQKPF